MRRLLVLTLSLVVTATASAPVLAGATPAAERRAAVHTVGGCAVFPADSPWNRRVDDRPVWRWSKAIVGKQAAGHDLHLDLGTTEEHYGIPVNVVDADQPLLPLQFGTDGEDYRDESDRGPVFVPADAVIEGGSTRDPDSGEHNTLDSVLVRVREGVEWLWELPDGTVAHLTGSGLPSYGVARIGPVYTPKEFRGRGIASYVVGELTRRGLEAGHRMCLFTDQANPTSNKIYAGLGYEPVVEMAEHLVRV